MHSWKRSWTGCWPRPGSGPGARYSMHWTGQNSGHFPHGQQRFTSMNATSRGRFFFSPSSSGTSGMRSSFSRRLMTSIADMAGWSRGRAGEAIGSDVLSRGAIDFVSRCSYSWHAMGRHQEPPPEDEPKDKVLHTRIPESLEDAIKDKARRLRIPVSNLVRNVLEQAFQLVE